MGVYLETESTIDGAPLYVAAVWSKANRKTGPVVQTYILRADIPPMEALRTGADESICGQCPHRPLLVNAGNGAARCYVTVWQGPRVVWDAIRRGRYTRTDAAGLGEYCRDRFLRLGAYGDPGAIASSLWAPALEACSGWAGYTHQWRASSGLRGICMASVDSAAERDEAGAQGWATFRVATTLDDGRARARGEARCPASVEAGARTQCNACPLRCDGRGRSVVILDHAPGGVARSL